MTIDNHLQQWWAARSNDQRRALKEAADEDRMDAATVRLLLDTGCPIGPIGTKWLASDSDYGWTWPQSVRTFVTANVLGP
jgi:hypothetical protein